MAKYATAVILFLFITTIAKANSFPKHKKWQIIVSSDNINTKGRLLSVTDSSITVVLLKGKTEEILFDVIDKIKFRPISSNGGKRTAGFLIAGIAGGVITGSAMSAKREGEPAALAGVVGGIGSGLLFGIAGAVAAPSIWHIFNTKRITVRHEKEYYPLLKEKLTAFAINK